VYQGVGGISMESVLQGASRLMTGSCVRRVCGMAYRSARQGGIWHAHGQTTEVWHVQLKFIRGWCKASKGVGNDIPADTSGNDPTATNWLCRFSTSFILHDAIELKRKVFGAMPLRDAYQDGDSTWASPGSVLSDINGTWEVV